MKSVKPSEDLSGIKLPPTPEVLEKHKRYKNLYGKREVYWGLGIECESYLELDKPVSVNADFIINNHKRERYSVDYFTSYKQDLFERAFSAFQAVHEPIRLPMLLNAHALSKTDVKFQHQTLYEKNTPSNPKFLGETIFEILQRKCPSYFKEKYDVEFTFDGDSIEIMTQNFYKATVESTLKEFFQLRNSFQENLQKVWNQIPELAYHGNISWTSGNHGLAIMATNPKNLAIFNNGTYHFNITLPTQLNEEGKIQDWPRFLAVHKSFIHYVQLLEPLLVANFGSPDPMVWLVHNLYAVGSQRGAMSRYIGLGTYDTDKMPRGKILTVDTQKVKSSWYNDYHKTSGYVKLDKIGVDINFNKHWNHGVEIRFFDWFPPERLHGVLKLLVYLGDLCFERPCIESPVTSPVWNAWMVRVLQKGCEAGLTSEEAVFLTSILGISCGKQSSLECAFAELLCSLRKKFQKFGECSKVFLPACKGSEISSCSPPPQTVPEVGFVESVNCCCLPKQKK